MILECKRFEADLPTTVQYPSQEKQMPLTRVTITGADDKTNQADLLALHDSFPFVELGILIGSHSRERFPSRTWIDRLVELRGELGSRVPLALHVCGKYLRDIAQGGDRLMSDLGPSNAAFDRVQLNWHGEAVAPGTAENVLQAFERMCIHGWSPEIIFQADGVNDDLYKPASRRFVCSQLFDRSHGAGIAPGQWPQATTEIACGWAGGLGPHNLRDEIPRISAQALPSRDHWIDMETHVRTGGKLDLAKCRHCLVIATPFIGH